jgi:hypothetical protein
VEKKAKITPSDTTSDRRKERKRMWKGKWREQGAGEIKMVTGRRSKWKKSEKKRGGGRAWRKEDYWTFRKRVWIKTRDRELEEKRYSDIDWNDLLKSSQDTVGLVGKEEECENKKPGRFKDERMKEINNEKKDEKIKRNEKNSG